MARKFDKVIGDKPKSKYLTDGKDYWIESISAGGYYFVKNDNGKVRSYAPQNFKRSNE